MFLFGERFSNVSNFFQDRILTVIKTFQAIFFALDYDFWMQKGNEELEIALNRIYKLRGENDVSKVQRPKNVLFFVGDGMSLTTITAARIYRGQQKQQRSGEELLLSWEEFPETALLKVKDKRM